MALLPTAAVLAIWVVAALALAGVGVVSERAVTRCLRLPGDRYLLRRAWWLGLAVLLVYLQLWSVFAPVDMRALLVPTVVGLLGLARFRKRVHLALSPALGSVLAVVAAVVAHRSLGPPTGYDLGLYHQAVVRYASEYAAIPGLANLHDRLGSASPHLLFVALLDAGPLAGLGVHLANGLLVTLAIVDLSLRVARTDGPDAGFSRRLAFVLLPATALAVGPAAGARVAGADLDAAAFVLVVMGAVYLSEAVASRCARDALVGLALIAAAAATRPLYWVTFAVSLVVTIVLLRTRLPSPRRWIIAWSTVPAALVVGLCARQTMLTGYPLFPISWPYLPVDWRVPEVSVAEMRDVIAAWARVPRGDPAEVLSSWAWVGTWWRETLPDPDAVFPLTVAVVALATLLWRLGRAAPLDGLTVRAFAVVATPAVVSLVAWFVSAPDIRFALASAWLLPLATLALALTPTGTRPPRARAVLIGGAMSVAILAAWVGGFFDLSRQDGTGPLGVLASPTPQLTPVIEIAGVTISRPRRGDRCYEVLWCTPQPVTFLRARGSSPEEGFISVR